MHLAIPYKDVYHYMKMSERETYLVLFAKAHARGQEWEFAPSMSESELCKRKKNSREIINMPLLLERKSTNKEDNKWLLSKGDQKKGH